MGSLILASASPRRKELLAALGIAFEVVPSRADETLPPGLDPVRGTTAVALAKARDVRGRLGGGRWILAADTSVVSAGRCFGKPGSRREAEEMLDALSGRSHTVVTGVALSGRGRERSLAVETEVRFRALSAAEIRWYASLREPYDKAGAYAIQGRGAFLVAAIRGSYTNVVGLPMHETVDLLEEVGLLPWAAETQREAAGA